tara:strand:- start:32 stop:136 length:105 start_codon:yes stop_codon:yes gene_type:complete
LQEQVVVEVEMHQEVVLEQAALVEAVQVELIMQV